MIGARRRGLHLAAAVIIGSALEPATAAEQRLELAARARYADLKDGANDGSATSLLTRLSLSSHWHEHFATYLEFDHVETGREDEHSDGVRFNGKPTIPDVAGSEINQLFARLATANQDLTLGRQAIELDNQRFIGSINFWQNEQTFDALFLRKELFSASTFNYGYLWNSNRIFGDDADRELRLSDSNYGELNGARPLARLGDHEHKTHLLRLQINEWDYADVVLYTYLIDNRDAPASANDTVGASYARTIKPAALQYRLEAEVAMQKRTATATEPTLPYLRFDAAIGFRSTELSLRHEQLGSKDGVAFITPLGSLHEFHGWADQFSSPPANGLTDQSVRLTWRRAPWKLDLRYHFFAAEEGSQTFGEEFDFDIIFKPQKKHNIMLRFADFKASNEDPSRRDTRRAFLSYSYNL